MLEQRQAMLDGELLPPSTRQEIADEMERFEAHVEYYRGRVNLKDEGVGFVSKPEGLPPEYPDPPEGYYYRSQSGDRWQLVSKDRAEYPQRELVKTADGWDFPVVEGVRPEARFPAGTTRQQAYDQLTSEHSTSTFKQWAEMVQEHGVATRERHRWYQRARAAAQHQGLLPRGHLG